MNTPTDTYNSWQHTMPPKGLGLGEEYVLNGTLGLMMIAGGAMDGPMPNFGGGPRGLSNGVMRPLGSLELNGATRSLGSLELTAEVKGVLRFEMPSSPTTLTSNGGGFGVGTYGGSINPSFSGGLGNNGAFISINYGFGIQSSTSMRSAIDSLIQERQAAGIKPLSDDLIASLWITGDVDYWRPSVSPTSTNGISPSPIPSLSGATSADAVAAGRAALAPDISAPMIAPAKATSFSGANRVPGTVLTQTELVQIKADLIAITGNHQMFLAPDPTWYEYLHEYYHVQHLKGVG